MADRIVKPDSGNDLVLQNDDASAKIEINEAGTIVHTGTSSIDVSGGTFTTSSAQKQTIVQAGPGSGTLDVSSGTFTTSSAQKTAIVDGGKGNLTKSDVGLGNVTNESKATMFTSPTFTGTPDLGSNPTVTLGTNTTFPGPPSSGTFNAGHIVQVIYTKTDTPFVTTTLAVGSEHQLFYSSNITTTGSNKVLIQAVMWIGTCNNVGFVLKRGTTVIGNTTQSAGTYLDTDWHAGADNMSNIDNYGLNAETINFLDSPGAGTHAYHIYMKAKGATGTINFNRPNFSSAYGTGVSNITLMEITA
tara:strand:+ start:1044 stop:1949 length:906 start_codon:yes stop_codon:yes gene_type:complete